MQRKGEIDREIDAEASGDCFFAYITKRYSYNISQLYQKLLTLPIIEGKKFINDPIT